MDKAFYIIANGRSEKSFELRSFEIGSPGEFEVQIKVDAFGLNFADVMARKGKYREAPPIPFIPGYDVVGTVSKVGTMVDDSWIGKRVAAFCRFGGYATAVNSNINAIIQINDTPSSDALSLCTQGVTAYYMSTYRNNFYPNEIALIHAAAGGVGILLIQMLKQKGLIVIAKVGSEEKKRIALSSGADYAINYNEEDYIEKVNEILGDKKINVIFNAVGGSTVKKDIKLLGPGGKLFLFGGAELLTGKWGYFSLMNFVRKTGVYTPIAWMMNSKSICGVNMLKIADAYPEIIQKCMQDCFEMYKNNELKPFTSTQVKFDGLIEIHDKFEKGETSGKLSIVWV